MGMHVVKSGETLASIAKKYSVSVHKLRSLNRIRKGQGIRVGMAIRVPSSVRQN
jgi:LysM repeat protein